MRILAFLVLAVWGLGTGVVGVAQSSSLSEQAKIHEQRAHQLLNEKKPELAVKEFAAVLAADPNNLDAQGNLGVLLYFQGKFADAEPHPRAAVEQQPSLTKIRALLRAVRAKAGKDGCRTNGFGGGLSAVRRHQDPNGSRL